MAEVPAAFGIRRNLLAAGAGVGRHQGQTQLGGQPLGAGLLHEVFVCAAEAWEPVENRYLGPLEGLGRQEHRKHRVTCKLAGVEAVAAMQASKAAVFDQ